jgi:peptide/nickel transport system substrate-binding protein
MGKQGDGESWMGREHGADLSARLAGRVVGRRELLKGALLIGAGAPFASSLLAACGTTTARSTGSGAQKGLTVASYGNAETLDPMASLDGQSPLLWRASYERLLSYQGNTTQYTPELAESYQISPDGTTYTFHLRSGIRFTDGEEMTSAAWKLSLERQIAINEGMAYALSGVSKVETPDDHTFVVHTDGFSDAFISAFSSNYGLFVISPKAITDHKGHDWAQSWLRDNVVGTGPYILDSYTPGVSATFSRNPNYWRGWTGNHAHSITVNYVHEASTAQLEIEGGSLDSAVLLPDNVVSALAGQAGVSVLKYPSLNLEYLGLNCKRGPTKDVKVRQAIAWGFDYESYVKNINAGSTLARQARGPIPSNMTEFVPGLPQYSFDPVRARGLLREARYPKGGFTLTCAVQDAYPWTSEMAQLFQSNMSTLGISVQIQSMAAAAFDGTESNPSTALDSVPLVWWPTLNTPYDYLFALYDTKAQGTAGYNYAYYSNPTFDSLLARAYSERDTAHRSALFGQAERIAIEDSPYLCVMEQPFREPQLNSVRGFQFNGFYIYTYDFYNMYVA